MFNRFWTVLALVSALCAGMLLTSKVAAAQDQNQTYYTYVSEWAVPRAQWAAFAKQDEASIAKMKQDVADGLLVAWGNEVTRVHTSDGFTHAEWFTATSRENLLKVLEGQWTTAINPSYVGATRHADLFLHTIAHGGKADAGGTGYLRVASYQAKPGAEDALESLLMGKVKAFIESEVSKGNVTLYNIDIEEVHTDMPGNYDLAMLFPDGAAMDRFYADFGAIGKSDPTVGVAFDSLTVGKEHRDDFGRVTAYQNK
ncbi:MAG TPA: hypothetical protein VGU63_03355 [Candidatus Acidoferrales bacterium]|nr:hypothetical protein [Candidatus Acidoferrales bacterium]